MMYYFVVAAFLLFLFVFWYLSDSVRALEGDMNTQMMYTTQSTADYVYYRLNRVAFSADALKHPSVPLCTKRMIRMKNTGKYVMR